MIRFIIAPDGAVAPDVSVKGPGRGVWVRADREAIELAIKRNAFARSAKRPAKITPGLADLVEARLAQRCLDLFSLGAKASALAIGFEQVEAAVRLRPPFSLLEAQDGAADGRDKLRKLHFGLWGEEARMIGCFTSTELGMALGRDRVVHAAWLQERMAQRWAVEISRLAGFRAITPASWL